MQYAVGTQYAVGVSAKTHAFSAKKVKPMQWGTQYAVGMQYTVGMQYAVGTQYRVGMQYAVGVSTKRSTHTMDLANVRGGDHYL